MVHLAFQVTGAVPGETIESVNIGGTLNAFDAAAAAGARRFVFASSVAAYGFHRDNPIGMTEDWPTRPAARLFYAQEKARLEHLLQARATTADGPALYLLRPSIVLGPHAVGAKSLPRGRARNAGPRSRCGGPAGCRSRCRSRSCRCNSCTKRTWGRRCCSVSSPLVRRVPTTSRLTGSSPPPRVARELGMRSFPVPPRLTQAAARAIAALPFLPPVAQWVEAACHPAIMDTTRAKAELGWVPEFTALETLRDTLRQYRK